MTAHAATVLNGVVLLAMSLWGYFETQSSPTALIPAAFGVLFLLMSPGVKAHNKAIAHIVVILAALLIVALVKPLMGTIDRGSTLGTVRVGAMMVTTVIALIAYVKSFIAARNAKS